MDVTFLALCDGEVHSKAEQGHGHPQEEQEDPVFSDLGKHNISAPDHVCWGGQEDTVVTHFLMESFNITTRSLCISIGYKNLSPARFFQLNTDERRWQAV